MDTWKTVDLVFTNVDPALIKMFEPCGQVVRTLSNNEVADILEDAADLYQAEQIEWCANEWITTKLGTLGTISVCAGGAIALASGVDLTTFYNTYSENHKALSSQLALDPRYDAFREVLDRTGTYIGEPVPSWNDNRLTPKSKADAIDMLRRAAKGIRDNIDKES